MRDTIDFGIDLGTTNSSVGLCRDGGVRLFPSADGADTTPSVVHVAGDGRILVGRRARDAWVNDPKNTQAEFKRWMGYSDKLVFPASGRSFGAEELSAEVLKSLRDDVIRAGATETLSAAVITVPAAFGSLQCDATARAALLAGFAHAPLLQEPVAAAIAYGAQPGSASQKWMVFDLGGGTLDIAVVSTRRGRLAVLEHQGDNRLGGKDIDRTIAGQILLPQLENAFNLPKRDGKTGAVSADERPLFDRLMRALVRRSEDAKIALSANESVTIELFDIGNDLDGKAIVATLALSRADVEQRIEPLVERCLTLAERALEGARLSKTDLDRVLLVGGPTQMQVFRAALTSRIGAKLDTSQDPMTAVARGAALHASTLENAATEPKGVKPAARSMADLSSSPAVQVQLSYERASGTAKSPVAGVLPTDAGVHEVKIESAGGVWTSGWVPVAGEVFQMDVLLDTNKPVTRFALSARDKTGKAVAVEPAKFNVASMLPMTAPPLPHTISIELATVDGVMQFDPLFARHSALPAEARRTYRADRTIRPSDREAVMPIKFWETEVSSDPAERWWAGCINVRADQLSRPIVEGSEIELTVRVDASRKMTVEVFVPLSNESFSEGVFIPDPPTARSHLRRQLDLCFAALGNAWRAIYEADRADLRERVGALQEETEELFVRIESEHERLGQDPDAALAPTDALRRIRAALTQIEEQLETDDGRSKLARSVAGLARDTDSIAADIGTDLEKQEAEQIRPVVQRAIDDEDARGLQWARQQVLSLRSRMLDRQPAFWQNVLVYLKRPGRRFLNADQAAAAIARAEAAVEKKDFAALREATSQAWSLQPPDQLTVDKEQAAQSGLRG